MTDPRIHLAVDNCFASKRWTTPTEWATLIHESMGLGAVEASADTECDPLYAPEGYLQEWREQVRRAEEATGVNVVNLYSGHGTYATLGLAHPDERVRDHILHRWMKPMAEAAGALGAGLGFFAHALPQSVLADAARYAAAYDDLCARLAAIASHAARSGASYASVEQMYSPHQPPWTVAGTEALLADVSARAGVPFYVTIDVGHQCGQRQCLRPTFGVLKEWLRGAMQGPPPWVGVGEAPALLREAVGMRGDRQDEAIYHILELADTSPFMFASYEDGDPYVWLERLGRLSPIVHIQQTDGTSSAHRPFTDQYNRDGIIEPRRVLQALHCSCVRRRASELPPPVSDIHLTIEVFSGTADTPEAIVTRMAETAAYWRKAVPVDGMYLSELVTMGASHHARTAA